MDESLLTKCMECGKEFRNYTGLARHLSQAHRDVSNQEYYDKYLKQPGDGVCQCCGKPTGFSGRLNRGYYEHCSNKCIAADRKVDEKRRATKMALYGDATFNNHDKTSQTKLERYGDANYANGDQIRATKLERYGEAGYNNVAKREATKLERFGDANFVNPAKGMATKAERYGDAHYNNPDKAAETKLERYGDIGYLNHDKASRTINAATIAKYNAALKGQCEILEYSNRTFRCRCNTCNSEFTIPITTGFYRLYRFGINWCTVCQPAETSRSKQEDALYEFVQGLLPDSEVRHSDRDTIPGIEMDIYVPSMKVAIEFDGLFWHDERHKTRIYHVNKTDRCESNGIHLLHVFEDEWVFQKDIVKSRIAGILGKNRTIYARKCSVIYVSADVAGKFLEENHIQGKCVSRWRYGLVFDGELVAVMTFGQNRFTSGIELLRYCSKCGTNVVGGAGRLFRRFTEENADISEVISYADRRWSGNGAFYSKIGFELVGKTYPSYYYVIGNYRHNRMEFMKQNLVAAGYPADKSEHDIMLSRGIYRIYDCGNWKYVWRRK